MKQKTKDMTKAIVTKTLIKLQCNIEKGKHNPFYNSSLGYHRLSVLPKKVRFNFDLAANLDTNWDGLKAINNQISFLQSLTEQEYINWLTIQ